MSDQGEGEAPRRRERAVALEYSQTEGIPRIVSSGVGEAARVILEVARLAGVPVRKDEVLTDMLSSLGVGQPISPEAYRLVAEILVFLYQSDRQWAAEHPEIGTFVSATSEASDPSTAPR